MFVERRSSASSGWAMIWARLPVAVAGAPASSHALRKTARRSAAWAYRATEPGGGVIANRASATRISRSVYRPAGPIVATGRLSNPPSPSTANRGVCIGAGEASGPSASLR